MFRVSHSTFFLISSIERNDIFAREVKHNTKSRVLKPMIEEDRAARITNQVAKRLKPRSRMQLLPDDQSNDNFFTFFDRPIYIMH